MAHYPTMLYALKMGTLHPGYPTIVNGYGLLYFFLIGCNLYAVSKFLSFLSAFINIPCLVILKITNAVQEQNKQKKT